MGPSSIPRVADDPDDAHRPWDWHDHEAVIWTAGVAVVLLAGLLVWAVVRVSDDARDPAQLPTLPPTTSQATTSTTLKTLDPTTSYTAPRPQTSEPDGPVSPPGPPGPPPPNQDAPQGDWTPPETSTTIYNPYAPTTTAGSAGHV